MYVHPPKNFSRYMCLVFNLNEHLHKKKSIECFCPNFDLMISTNIFKNFLNRLMTKTLRVLNPKAKIKLLNHCFCAWMSKNNFHLNKTNKLMSEFKMEMNPDLFLVLRTILSQSLGEQSYKLCNGFVKFLCFWSQRATCFLF